jgi:hypothetical protein
MRNTHYARYRAPEKLPLSQQRRGFPWYSENQRRDYQTVSVPQPCGLAAERGRKPDGCRVKNRTFFTAAALPDPSQLWQIHLLLIRWLNRLVSQKIAFTVIQYWNLLQWL